MWYNLELNKNRNNIIGFKEILRKKSIYFECSEIGNDYIHFEMEMNEKQLYEMQIIIENII